MKKNVLDLSSYLFIVLPIIFLTLISIFILNSIYDQIFPSYLYIIAFSFLVFFVVSRIDFEIFVLFSTHFYIISILLLIITLVLGHLTRGVVRWLGVGPASFQPSEIVRPFLVLFAAKYFSTQSIKLKAFIKGLLLILIPSFLVFMQPSFGMSIVLLCGFAGVIFLSNLDKKFVISLPLIALVAIPVLWLILAPYQKSRISSFLTRDFDKLGANYNSIQSVISVGSGGLIGRGLGKGVQTQLSFLPEKQTDFMFASISEELGFVGSCFVLLLIFIILWRILLLMQKSKSVTYRLYVAGVFTMLLSETLIHVGMNLGILPVTGIPLPYLSAGGSAYLSSSILIGLCLAVKEG